MSPSVRQWALLFASIAFISSGHGETWSEDTCQTHFDICSELFDDSQDILTCDIYNETIHCLGTYLDKCVELSLSAGARRNMTIKSYYCPDGCHPSAVTQQECINSFFPPPVIEPPQPSINCTYTPPLNLPISNSDPPISSLGKPSHSVPIPSSPECTLPAHNTFYRQHCSMFSLSHLRTFSDRNIPLQTCVLLGEVYLLKHESLSIAVNGAFKTGNAGHFYTDISQVNVTLHSHSCFPHSVSYTATVQEDLPHTVPGLNEQLLTVTNGTVATIIAPWINTTIIIHRSQDYLSVTLQVPEPLTRSSDITGLCSEGCPTGFEVSDTDVEVTDYMCADNRLSVLVMCLTLDLTLPPVGSMTYTKLCAYDILLTHNLDLLSLYFALNEDALMLPDVIEFEVTTSPTEITTSSSSSSSRTTPTPTDQPVSTIIIISPTVDGVISRTVCTQPLSPLMLFLSCLLLVSLRLR